ncbi:hypothetical protein O6H91_02G019600 [Diphasiastrum complanatum]|nr:hypothetical protein O6H91_02G019600 [Diphasiastrum complanatum]
MNGRYFASKQILCEFVGVTRWKVAICGEYMKAHHRPCSHGTACNFLHCFRNPGGEYDWADWDSPPPLYWQDKMEKLFGYREANQNHDDKRKGHEYRKRRYDGYNRQPARDHTSNNRHRSLHTHNRQDDRSRFWSSSNKQHHELRHSRDLNRQRYKRNHSETDSEKTQGSYSEDGCDTRNNWLRSSETRKESKRRCHDDEREWSTDMDSDNSYIKQRKRQVSTDTRKQTFEDSDTNWSDPESKRETRFPCKQEKRHIKELDYESGASQTSNSGDGLGQKKDHQRDRRRKSSDNQHEYMKRHHNGYNQQPVRDGASDSRYRRYNTRNRHDNHGTLQSGSGKHRHRSQCSRYSNSQHERRHHSETDSEKLNASYSEDSYDAQNHRLRSPETRKEPKRSYCDNERDESTGFHLKVSNSQCYTRNHSETDSEKLQGLYPADNCDTPNHRLSETRKKWKRKCHVDEPDGSTGIDSDGTYNKKRKRHISIDRKKQKFEDSDSDWSQPDSDKQKNSMSQTSKRKGSEKDSERSDHGKEVMIPKSKLLANRKHREKHFSDVPERPEGSQLMDALESTHRNRLSRIKNKSESKRSETGKDSEHEDDSEKRPHKHKHSKSRKSHGTRGLDSVDLEDRWQDKDGHLNGKLSTDDQ